MEKSRSHGLLDVDVKKEAEELGNLLRKFALKRGRSISEPGWDRDALLIAAFEHPELQLRRNRPNHRKPGRPAFPKGLHAIFSGPQPLRHSQLRQIEFDRLALEIDAAIRLAVEQKRKPPTTVSIIREHVAKTTSPMSPHFKRRVQSLKSDVSRAMKRLRNQSEFEEMLRENPRNF